MPRDPDDSRDVIIEVKAGEGGEESALFASDLARMYSRYAERQGWAVEVLDATDSDLGGYKDVRLAIKARGPVEPQDGVWAHLKYEGGVHRVQRVPVTESQAASTPQRPASWSCRRQTTPVSSRSTPPTCASTSSAPRGRGARVSTPRTRPCASRTLPTGIVVSMQNEKSQLQNKEAAMRSCGPGSWPSARRRPPLRRRRPVAVRWRTVDRSERIRTYNFPENRIADHRTGFKAYNLDAVR